MNDGQSEETVPGAQAANADSSPQHSEIPSNNSQLEDILGLIPAGVIFFDCDYRISRINDVGKRAIGLNADEDVLGKTFFDLDTTISRSGLSAALKKVVAGEEPLRFWSFPIPANNRSANINGENGAEKSDADENQTSFWDFTIRALRDCNSGEAGFLLFAVEVTDRVSAERSLQNSVDEAQQTARKLQSLIEQMTDGVIVCDERGEIQTFNKAAQNLLGSAAIILAPDSGKNPDALLKHVGEDTVFSPEDFPWRRASLEGQTSVNVEMQVGEEIGRATVISINSAPLRDMDDALAGSVSVLHDVTENRRLINELSEANRRLEEFNRLKAEFVANMSHELRTPLNAILGFAQITQMKSRTEPLTDSQALSLERILRNGRNLLRLIDDVLDISKIEAGHIAVQPDYFDVVKVVQGAFGELESLAVQKGLKYSLKVEGNFPLSYSDPLRIKQIVTNLLSNAIKFTTQGSVEAALKFVGEDKWSFEVRDTGTGIKPESLDLIFQRFTQVDGSMTRAVGGVGLGLYIAQQIADLLGGELSARSEFGQGSTFIITLPLVISEENILKAALQHNFYDFSTELNAQSDEKQDSSPLVLVVDDNPDSISLLAETLTRSGYRVEKATDGEMGLRLTRELLPSAVILDIMMPRMDGWRVLQAMKADERTIGIPVIVCSIVDNRPLGYRLGASEYLLKPVEPARLVETVESIVGNAQVEGDDNYVLVVDDEYGIREMIVTALKQAGYAVRGAASGEIAFQLAVKQTPQAVLCDLMMPGGMSGFELIARLRVNPSTAQTPIVVITGKETTPEDRELMRGQIAEVIRKGDLLLPNVEERLQEVLSEIGVEP